jgi:glycosyltransferase involved in cell wall biosynthesis
MKHVAMLIPTIDQIGGAERQVMLLAKELSARGWKVTLLVLSGTGTGVASELKAAGVVYLSLGMRKAWIDPRGWLRYLAWFRLNKPDIIHAHLPHATCFARWVRLLAPVRVVVDTIHTSHTGSRSRQLGYRLSDWLSNHVTCVSAAVADAAVCAHMALRKDLTILPNGIPIPPTQSTPQNSSVAPFQWIAVGRLSAIKDYPTLLHAFAILQGNPKLKILGSGPEKDSLRQLAAQLQIGDRAQFPGFASDIQPHLAAADAFVLSSLWEGLPVSVLEAAAAGLPVVVTDGAGTREAMLPGETGLLVPVSDVAALSCAMATVMAMPPEERRKTGERGRQFVTQNFSLPSVAGKWEQLYGTLLKRHPHPSRHG